MKRPDSRPPALARLLQWLLLADDDYAEFTGDMNEMYRYRSRQDSPLNAKTWYWCRLVESLPSIVFDNITWSFIMLKNYLKVAYRTIQRNKVYSMINLAGLTVGLTCFILIFVWARHELSYDRFHENADHIYRINERQYQSSGEYFPVAVTPWPLGPALQEEYPEIVNNARLRILSNVLTTHEDNQFYEDDICAVDPSFFEMFSFKPLKGDPETWLSEPNNILLSAETAQKYFPDEDPIGKTLWLYQSNFVLTVKGVFENVPDNSHIRFDFLFPFETLNRIGWTNSWGTNNYTTYVQVQKDADIAALREKVRMFFQTLNPEARTQLVMQNVTDIHLRSNNAIDLYGHSEESVQYIYAFLIVAVFVILIACINFMNLSTARSVKRAKEIGMRKVAGANRKDVIKQFYSETFLLTFSALAFSLLLVYLLLPLFNGLTGRNFSMSDVAGPEFIAWLCGIVFLTGLLSGSYPALVMSSYRPVKILKGVLTDIRGRHRGAAFRKALVMAQFTISILLIIGTLIVSGQIEYMLNRDLGYDDDYLVYFSKRGAVRSQFDAFKQELLNLPGVSGVTASSDIPTYTVHSTDSFSCEGVDEETSFLLHQFTVDPDYLGTMGITLSEGRDFPKEFTEETPRTYILNEAAVRALDLQDPVGKIFTLYGVRGAITGIIKDYHYKSLHEPIEPLVMRVQPGSDRFVIVRVAAEDIGGTLAFIEEAWDTFNPEYPFAFMFLDGTAHREDIQLFHAACHFHFVSRHLRPCSVHGAAAHEGDRRAEGARRAGTP
ncbi:ABC transporter permease, partial [candidate division KSB1 bacterium]